jgi:hypothetical protein
MHVSKTYKVKGPFHPPFLSAYHLVQGMRSTYNQHSIDKKVFVISYSPMLGSKQTPAMG